MKNKLKAICLMLAVVGGLLLALPQSSQAAKTYGENGQPAFSQNIRKINRVGQIKFDRNIGKIELTKQKIYNRSLKRENLKQTLKKVQLFAVTPRTGYQVRFIQKNYHHKAAINKTFYFLKLTYQAKNLTKEKGINVYKGFSIASVTFGTQITRLNKGLYDSTKNTELDGGQSATLQASMFVKINNVGAQRLLITWSIPSEITSGNPVGNESIVIWDLKWL